MRSYELLQALEDVEQVVVDEAAAYAAGYGVTSKSHVVRDRIGNVLIRLPLNRSLPHAR